ncbi:MAG: type II 3-dehydroquinate dehydratase [Candidatus Omnitrophota bacterium]
MKKILVIHGPNLALLGSREINVYGKVTLKQINAELLALAKKNRVTLKIAQSDHEGEIVGLIGKSKGFFDALLINPAAYTHTSVAIRDAISAIPLPCVEVHLSNIYQREEFRHTSLIAPVACGQICGFGLTSYLLGLEALISLLKERR